MNEANNWTATTATPCPCCIKCYECGIFDGVPKCCFSRNATLTLYINVVRNDAGAVDANFLAKTVTLRREVGLPQCQWAATVNGYRFIVVNAVNLANQATWTVTAYKANPGYPQITGDAPIVGDCCGRTETTVAATYIDDTNSTRAAQLTTSITVNYNFCCRSTITETCVNGTPLCDGSCEDEGI